MVAPASLSSSIDSIDPATGDLIARFQVTTSAEVPSILARARRAQAAWSAEPLRARCARLRRLRETIYERRQEIADLVTHESGKPRVEALFADVLVSLDTADYYANQAAELLRPERVSHHNPAVKAKSGWLHYEPYGAIGLIAPWNYPLAIPLGQAIPAVVAGNAVVLKPSELTPSCGALVGELFARAGFPTDLVQVIQGGGELGAALIEAGPAKIIFTGSVATGRRVAEACARRLIPCVLELGGKDAMIVLADADVEVASSAAVWGSFTNCGQACLSVERIYVEREIAERFSERCAAKTQLLKLGPGSDPHTEVGPMIRAAQVDRVEEQLREAIARGARILAGGRRRPDLGPCFFEPTVVADVDHSMRMMQEETFGPVLALRSVADAEEAVVMANDSAFGLAASIWTGDSRRGRRLGATPTGLSADAADPAHAGTGRGLLRLRRQDGHPEVAGGHGRERQRPRAGGYRGHHAELDPVVARLELRGDDAASAPAESAAAATRDEGQPPDGLRLRQLVLDPGPFVHRSRRQQRRLRDVAVGERGDIERAAARGHLGLHGAHRAVALRCAERDDGRVRIELGRRWLTGGLAAEAASPPDLVLIGAGPVA